mmetsp:Transcript_5733/g.9022  ORF Transcript_5733/g.9022 Transcript_5733/m.9022 type:complete len:214 (+) Transcript_5733:526-1167(+)
MDSLLDDTVVVPPHRSYSNELNPEEALSAAGLGLGLGIRQQYNQPQRALLHTLPLLPKHALQHRQRRELIANSLPIPEHLQEGIEDELYHAENAHRRRRVYPVLHHENGDELGKVAQVVDARMLQQDADEGNNGSAANQVGTTNNEGTTQPLRNRSPLPRLRHPLPRPLGRLPHTPASNRHHRHQQLVHHYLSLYRMPELRIEPRHGAAISFG